MEEEPFDRQQRKAGQRERPPPLGTAGLRGRFVVGRDPPHLDDSLRVAGRNVRLIGAEQVDRRLPERGAVELGDLAHRPDLAQTDEVRRRESSAVRRRP